MYFTNSLGVKQAQQFHDLDKGELRAKFSASRKNSRIL